MVGGDYLKKKYNMKNKAAQEMARLSHKKSPRGRDFYVKISAMAAEARKRNREERKRIADEDR